MKLVTYLKLYNRQNLARCISNFVKALKSILIPLKTQYSKSVGKIMDSYDNMIPISLMISLIKTTNHMLNSENL